MMRSSISRIVKKRLPTPFILLANYSRLTLRLSSESRRVAYLLAEKKCGGKLLWRRIMSHEDNVIGRHRESVSFRIGREEF
jgi:hypothetical protein